MCRSCVFSQQSSPYNRISSFSDLEDRGQNRRARGKLDRRPSILASASILGKDYVGTCCCPDCLVRIIASVAFDHGLHGEYNQANQVFHTPLLESLHLVLFAQIRDLRNRYLQGAVPCGFDQLLFHSCQGRRKKSRHRRKTLALNSTNAF